MEIRPHPTKKQSNYDRGSSLVFDGDFTECAKWVGFAHSHIHSMTTSTPGTQTKIIRPVENVEIRLETRPNRVFIKAGVSYGLFVVIKEKFGGTVPGSTGGSLLFSDKDDPLKPYPYINGVSYPKNKLLQTFNGNGNWWISEPATIGDAKFKPEAVSWINDRVFYNMNYYSLGYTGSTIKAACLMKMPSGGKGFAIFVEVPSLEQYRLAFREITGLDGERIICRIEYEEIIESQSTVGFNQVEIGAKFMGDGTGLVFHYNDFIISNSFLTRRVFDCFDIIVGTEITISRRHLFDMNQVAQPYPASGVIPINEPINQNGDFISFCLVGRILKCLYSRLMPQPWNPDISYVEKIFYESAYNLDDGDASYDTINEIIPLWDENNAIGRKTTDITYTAYYPKYSVAIYRKDTFETIFSEVDIWRVSSTLYLDNAGAIVEIASNTFSYHNSFNLTAPFADNNGYIVQDEFGDSSFGQFSENGKILLAQGQVLGSFFVGIGQQIVESPPKFYYIAIGDLGLPTQGLTGLTQLPDASSLPDRPVFDWLALNTIGVTGA